MDLSFSHLLSTDKIIEVLLQVRLSCCFNSGITKSSSFQRQIRIESLAGKSRSELIEIYNKLVLPLPQRTATRNAMKPSASHPPPSNRLVLKRKVTEGGDSGESPEKVVRNGLHGLKLKRTNSMNDDDPMDGSQGTKRKPITWP